MWSLDNKVVLVTGASRGIGRSTALILGQAGATVIGTATTESGAEKITDYLKQHNINGQGLALNVTDNESIKSTIDFINENYAPIDILVNNAGITRDNIMLRMKEEEWDAIIDTNLTSIFKMTKAVLKGMTKARAGRIINIASVVGVMGNPGQANYAAAKAGVIGFSKSLAKEIGSRNITVNVVAPGFIKTDMTDHVSEKQKAALNDAIALTKLGEVEDIANTVLFLASDAAKYITGETIHVNGGLYMH